MTYRRIAAVGIMFALSGSAACADDPAASPDAGARVDAGAPDGGPECYENPTTHLEIINACTRSQHVDKTPVLPLLQADGTLPPLP